MSLLTRLISVRVHSKKDDFVAPVEPLKKVILSRRKIYGLFTRSIKIRSPKY